MQKLHLLLSVSLLSLSSFALADDQQPAPPAKVGGYIGVMGGLSNQSGGNPVFVLASNGQGQSYSAALDNGFDLNIHGGYRYNNFRIEGEFAHLQNNIANISNQDWNTNLIMMNGYYDFDMETPLIPYVGAGMGLAIFPDNVANYSIEPSSCEFAYQGISGLGYRVNSSLILVGEYSYVGYTNLKGNHSNLFNLGLNYFF